jgi:integrase
MTWDDALSQWEAWSRASGHTERTIEQRRWCLRRFAASMGCGPWDVTLARCVTFLGRPGWAPETRRSYRGAIRSFYTWALDYELIAVDPTRKLPRITPPPVEPRPAPDAVLAAALASASDRDRLLLLVAGRSGLRRAEIAGLRWDRISEGRLRILGKGGRVRTVPLHPELFNALNSERARRDAGRFGSGYRYTGHPESPYVFPGRSGGSLTPNAVSKIAARVLGPGWGAHSLRHRFATKAYSADRDLLATMRLLGHTKPETTQRYADVPPGALERAVLAAGGR